MQARYKEAGELEEMDIVPQNKELKERVCCEDVSKNASLRHPVCAAKPC